MTNSKNLIGFLLALTGIGFAFYFLIWPFFLRIRDLYLVNFDIWPYITNWSLNFDLLSLDFRRGFIIVFLFTATMIFFYFSHVNVNEKIKKFGIIPLIPYFLIYYIFKGAIFLLSIAELVVKKKQKW